MPEYVVGRCSQGDSFIEIIGKGQYVPDTTDPKPTRGFHSRFVGLVVGVRYYIEDRGAVEKFDGSGVSEIVRRGQTKDISLPPNTRFPFAELQRVSIAKGE